jgi:hypothetical protein
VVRQEAERRRSLELTSAAGNGARMRENKIGGAEEHQRVTAELWLHWIGVRGWCGRLSTMARDGRGGRVKGGDRSRRN